MNRLIFLILIFLPMASEAFLLRNNLRGVRPLGMGNAFLAISDDNNALWYNPAGLAREKSYHGNLFDFSLGVDSLSTLGQIENAVVDGDFNNLVRRDTQQMKFNAKPTFMMPYFAFSLYDEIYSFTDFKDLNSLSAQVDIYSYNDIGLITGFAVPFGEYVAGGASVRIFQRSAIDAELTTESILDLVGIENVLDFESAIYDHLQQLMGMGWAVGLNVGALVRIPLAAKTPKLMAGVTIEDVGYTSFRTMGVDAVPQTLRMKYNAGIGLRYNYSPQSEFNLALDYRDYFHYGNQGTILRRIHFGAEYRGGWFGLRMGLNQGYPTFGFSITAPPHTQIHFATYANELGTGLHERMQRCFELQLIIGFNPI